MPRLYYQILLHRQGQQGNYGWGEYQPPLDHEQNDCILYCSNVVEAQNQGRRRVFEPPSAGHSPQQLKLRYFVQFPAEEIPSEASLHYV